jgi:adenylate kinase family enzyme
VRRVIVIGNTGSGKSTFGTALAAKLGVPYTDSDDLFWLPGWQEVPNEDFRASLEDATSGEEWVLVGNYLSRATDITWPRADTIVWLDLPLVLVLSRSVRRTATRAVTREVVCNGNVEKLRFLLPERFSGETPLWQYALRHHKVHRPIIETMLADAARPDLTVHRLRSRAEVARFLVATEAQEGR